MRAPRAYHPNTRACWGPGSCRAGASAPMFGNLLFAEVHMADIPKWRVKGDWFDTCSCSIPCPCTFAQPPTGDTCEGVLAWHIREGSYGDVSLNGLNVMALGVFKGNIWEGQTKATMALFIDERADERQREALQMVFGGRVGGWPGTFANFIGEVRGMEFARIDFHGDEHLGSWRAESPRKPKASGEERGGPTTAPSQPTA